MAYQMEHDLSQEIMADTDIVHMTRTDVAVVSPDFTITEVLHKLVDESFLPVVDASGIFPRNYHAQVYPQGSQCPLA